jgi:hypothetical protein
MHNCKTTQGSLTDLAMDEIEPSLKKQLLAELQECPACYEEYAATKGVLRITGQALRATAPADEFWSSYHARLVNRIENYSPPLPQQRLFWGASVWQLVRKVVTASVHVPVPVAAAAVLLLVGVSSLFVWRAQGQDLVAPIQSVITRTVEVPVIQEKVVTRVVYVEKYRNRSRSVPSELNFAQAAKAGTGFAQADSAGPVTPSMSLIGFKPTDQVQLKVMKGSYRDDQ